MKKIQLTQGKVALIDDVDFEYVGRHKWCYHKFNNKGYAVRSQKLANGKYKTIYMHRFLLDEPENLEIDHINGDTLDNRRSNLRACTHKENLQNHKNYKFYKTNTSGVRGVYYNRKSNSWSVNRRVGNKNVRFGTYKNKNDAIAIARMVFPSDVQLENSKIYNNQVPRQYTGSA